MTREELKNILESSTQYTWIGIRGVNEELKIGETLGTSYLWDHEYDQSTYGTDREEELGGVCATDVTTANWAQYYRDDDDIEEMVDYILEKKELNDSYYYNNQYLIASNSRNPYGYDENDEAEAILEDAVVLAKF